MNNSITCDLTQAQALYYQDLKRLRGRRGLLFELLLDGAWHANYELASAGGLSFNDSIHAFRKEGWIIESRPKKGGVWEFRLVGKGEPPTEHKPMSRPQRLVAAHYMQVIQATLGYSAASTVRKEVPAWMRTTASKFVEASIGGDT